MKPCGPASGVVIGNSVTSPAVVMRTMFGPFVVNHRLPSGPDAISLTMKPLAASENDFENSPVGVMQPTALAWGSAYQMLPSDPAVMKKGVVLSGAGYSVATPSEVMLPMVCLLSARYQTSPPGPAMTWSTP